MESEMEKCQPAAAAAATAVLTRKSLPFFF